MSSIKKIAMYVASLLGFKKPFVVIMVDGGLASQLNKYIIGHYIKKNSKWDVKYDLSWFDDNGKCIQGINSRSFNLLDCFLSIDDFEIATPFEKKFAKSTAYVETDKPFLYFEKLTALEKFVYVGGYFTNWEYIKDFPFEELEMHPVLSDKNREIQKSISESSHSVSLHVRRGDYVGSAHDVLTVDYFVRAVSEIKSKIEDEIQLFIFSNDTDWVRSMLLPKLVNAKQIYVVDSNSEGDGGIDFFLMSQCEYNICSNSGFSFFAALMNSNDLKKIIIPDKWLTTEDSFAEGSSEAFIDSGVQVVKA